jgi:hypothetical protein
MARVTINIGDVFEVPIDENSKKYFQVIAFDSTQLSSSVIRAFKKKYNPTEKPGLSDIIHDEVDFYAHCFANVGVKLNFWRKVGNITKVGPVGSIVFRDTNDYGRKLGEEPVKVSNNWYVWRVNDENFTKVGKLKGENQKAEIGLVFSPKSIVERMCSDKYDLKFYPGY